MQRMTTCSERIITGQATHGLKRAVFERTLINQYKQQLILCVNT